MAVLDGSSNHRIEDILDGLQPRIRATFARFRIPPSDAEDVLQQTLLIYLYKRDRVVDPEKWIIGALKNRCLLYWRSRRRRLYTNVDKAVLESVAGCEDSCQARSDFARDLSGLLAELPERCRRIFELRYWQGWEPSEAAQKLGYRASSIYKVTERCLAALTRRMVSCGLVEDEPDA